MLIGGRINNFIPNPTFDPVIVPGCTDLMFRGQVPKDIDPRTIIKVEPLSRCYQDRQFRLDKLDEQGLDAILLFPTLGCGVEQALSDDIPATMASLVAFNRWLEEAWGFSYRDRIIAAPMISLADPEAALAEVDYVVSRGGSDWVHALVKVLRKQANRTPWAFPDDPLDVLRGHVWVTPYYEEDIRRLADVIGVERVLFGSDWPHGEGLAVPTSFADELDGFDAREVSKIMRDNCIAFLGGSSR